MPPIEGDPDEHIVVIGASGTMRTKASSEIRVRNFPPLTSDEAEEHGGANKGPSPLEYVLVGLCA